MLKKVLAYLYSYLISLRYDVHVEGISLLQTKGGKLFLSNHQALVDPQILIPIIFKIKPIRPILIDDYLKIPLVGAFINIMNPIPVSNPLTGKRDIQLLDRMSHAIMQALDANEQVLLYPSGQLTVNGLEIIKNKKSAHHIISLLTNDTRIIGVRISGLWGSSWSKSGNGKTPNLILCFLKGFVILFFNLFFFTPRRKVYITFEDITDYAKSNVSFGRDKFNLALESFFNKSLAEVKINVPYHFITI